MGARKSPIRLLSTWVVLFALTWGPSNFRSHTPPPPSGPTALQPVGYLPLVLARSFDFDTLARATWASLNAMLEPETGLIHDRFDASLFDIVPQFAVMRTAPYVSTAPGAALDVQRCKDPGCRYQGDYGLMLTYTMPSATWGTFNLDSRRFDAHEAQYLDLWVKGNVGGERFEVVLWSNCQGGFPGRPNSALLTASTTWQKQRIPLVDYQAYANPGSLCRLSLGFSDSIHPGGRIYVDQLAFVNGSGQPVHVPFNEETNVTNVGLYISSVVGAVSMGIDTRADAVSRMMTTLTSLETLTKWHGFPQTHNYVVSLEPSNGDKCISTVDSGNLAAGLMVLRQGLPELADRAGRLLDAMEWDWLFDSSANLPYGCRYPDGSASVNWHYDWLVADSRLAHFIGIGANKFPPSSWSGLNRAHETPRCSTLWHFEPGWDGGGMFMYALPALFIDETGSEIETANQNFVQDQICLAKQIGAPAWGWSAAGIPPYGSGYCGYGQLCDDLLAPYASILAANRAQGSILGTNLRNLEALNARKPATNGTDTFDYGFRDSVLWRTGQIAEFYLSLDQGMSFLAIFNWRNSGGLKALFCQDPLAQSAINKIPDYSGACK
jgi:hypothetical protein